MKGLPKRIPSSSQLLAACRSQNSSQQFDALPLLCQYYPDIATKVLIELLTSPESAVRWKVANLLGEHGKKDATIVGPALVQTLEDSEQLVRNEAMKSLINLGYPLPKKLLVSRLHDDPDWRGRSTAAKAMGDLNDATVLPELEDALQKETTPAVRAHIVRSIGLLASSEYLPKLEKYFSIDSVPAVQRELFAACYRLGDQTKLEPLLLLLKEVDAKAAWSILFTIQYLVASRPPTSLRIDSAVIRKAITDFTTRLPAFSIATQTLLTKLKKLETQS